jgi:quinol monooxygenase YgiN
MARQQVIALARVKVKPGKGNEFVAGMREAVKVLREDTECHGVTVYRGVESPDQFVVSIAWTSIEAHKAFVAGPRLERYRAPTLEIRDGPPESAHYEVVIEDS